MASHGDGTTPVWVTEFGWSTHPNVDGLQPWERGVTERQQSRYTAEMMAYLERLPQVGAAFVYRDRDFTSGNLHQDGFGILREDNTRKPVYDVLTCSPAARCLEMAEQP